MKGFQKMRKIIMPLILTLTLLSLTNVQAQQQENMETFFDSAVPGIKIQVNATAETKPAQNITISLLLKKLDDVSEVSVKCFNFSIYGFLRGQNKTLLYSILDNNFSLGSKSYQRTFKVPEEVWEVTYGEITLAYDAKYYVGPGWQVMPYSLVFGFTMTKVENVYLKSLEEQLMNLQQNLDDLNQTFQECFGKSLTRDELLNLNQTLRQLQQDYETLKGIKSELDNTRTAVVFLAVVAVFFVATTAYLTLRKPKSYL